MVEARNIDYLTGLPLRDRLYSSLEELINRSGLEKKVFSVVLIDVDKFKDFNDKFGHFLGDKILEYVTHIITSHFSEIECRFFRYGGDEFIIVMLGKNAKQAHHLVRACAADVSRRPYMFKNKLHRITLSCGIACFPEDGLFVEELLHKADKAMYFSKRHGRNAVIRASEIRHLNIMRGLLVWARILGVIALFLFILWFPPIRTRIQAGFDKTQDTEIVEESEDVMTLRLKNNRIVRGRMVKETEEEMTLQVTVDKSQILEVR